MERWQALRLSALDKRFTWLNPQLHLFISELEDVLCPWSWFCSFELYGRKSQWIRHAHNPDYGVTCTHERRTPKCQSVKVKAGITEMVTRNMCCFTWLSCSIIIEWLFMDIVKKRSDFASWSASVKTQSPDLTLLPPSWQEKTRFPAAGMLAVGVGHLFCLLELRHKVLTHMKTDGFVHLGQSTPDVWSNWDSFLMDLCNVSRLNRPLILSWSCHGAHSG